MLKDDYIQQLFATLAAKKDCDQIAIMSNKNRISYRNLVEKVNRLAEYFCQSGFLGKVVAIMLKDDVQASILILAALKVQINYICLDAQSSDTEIDKIIQQIKPDLFINQNIIDTKTNEFNFQLLKDFHTIDTKKLPNSQYAFITLSSGSTSYPKAIQHTYCSLNIAVENVRFTLNLHKRHKLLCTVMHTSNAFMRNLIASLVREGTFIIAHDLAAVLKLIAEEKPTHVRFTIKLLLELSQQVDLLPGIFKCVQQCDVSGDTLPHHVVKRLKKLLGNRLITSYAMSECGTISVGSVDDKHYTTHLIPGFKAKVIDQSGRLLPLGQIGELCLQSDALFKSYIGEKVESLMPFTSDGWFQTGDYFSMNADHSLQYRGRKKNIIIKNGKNISPEYIKDVLLGWPQILDCVVVGDQSDLYIEEPIAFCSKADKLDLDAFKTYVSKRLHPFLLPKQIFILDQLPRNHFGKINQAAVQAMRQASVHAVQVSF